jgi:aminopeptidase N
MTFLYRVILFLLLGGTAWSQHCDIHLHRQYEMRRYEMFAKRDAFVPASMASYDVTHYHLDISFGKDAALPFRGNVTMTFNAVADGLTSIDVHLGTNANMDSVVTRGASIDRNAMTRSGDVLTIPLPYTLDRNESSSVTMYYTAAYAGSGVIIRSVQNVVLNEQTTSIATQSEPYDARTWWPCKDDPMDKADSVDIRITVPEDLYPVSNGLVVSDQNNGDGTRTVHWTSKYPIVTYLVSVAAAKYNFREFEFSYENRTMPVGSWWYGMPAQNMSVFEQDMLDGLHVLSDLFGVYPFINEKYGMAEYEWGGAMEHQTVSSMGFYSTGVVIHELMHQWFGDKVTCESFHHIWLNEGWATYGEALFFESQGGLPALKADMARKAFYGPGTIYVSDPSSFARIFNGSLSYNKASWVVHMLRRVLGDEVFFEATRKYLGDERPESYRSVGTAEFQHYMEAESGLDLDDFFRNWIFGEYYPTYQYEWSSNEQAGAYEVNLTIEQLYQAERQLFIMPIDMYMRYADGSDTTIVIQNNQAVQQYSMLLPKKVESVQLDPDNWILKRVIEKVSNPTFDKGLLVVNGIDWDEDAYTDDLTTAFRDSVFSGGQPYTLWDLFPNPSVGYPDGVPEPIGSGPVPANVLGQYCTIVWLGNAYNGDQMHWNNTSIMEYIRAGGNLILMSRYGQQFLSSDMRQFLGITWAGSTATIRNCSAALPSLIDMEFTGDQSLCNPFNLSLSRNENTILFTETRGTNTLGIGVWGKPLRSGEDESGHMMFVSLRPYRINPLQLKTNMAAMLDELPCIPVLSAREAPGRAEGLELGAVYPNPAPAHVARIAPFTLPPMTQGKVTLRVHDVLGRVVREIFNGSLQPGEYALPVELHGLRAGVYMLVLHSDNRSVSRSVVVLD